MAITEILKQILSARYGRDVRQAIHDGIQQCYYDGKAGAIDLEARQGIQAIEGDVEALKESTNATNQAVQTLESNVADLQSAQDITTTTSTTQPNSYAGREMVLEIGGVTEQESTAGNQLCESVTIGPETNIYNSALIIKADFKPNTQYTFSFKGAVGNRYYINENAFVEDFTVTVVDGINTFTATTKDDFSGQVSSDGCLVLKNHKNQENQNKFEEVMVNLGNTALPYEPYTGGQPAPNPSYPMPIKNSKVKGIKTHNKNFFDITTLKPRNYYQGGTVSFIGDVANISSANQSWATLLSEEISVKKERKYIFSFKISNYSATTSTYIEVSNNGKSIGYLPFSKDGYYAIQIIPTDNVLQINICSNGSNDGVKNTFTMLEVQFEEGEVATPYEPYTESSHTFSQPIELYGKDGVQDVITPQNVERAWAEYTVPSTISVTLYDDVDGISRYRVNASPKAVDNDAHLLSEYFSSGYTLQEINTMKLPYKTCIYAKELWFTTQRGEYTADAFKEFIAGKKIYYSLQTPTTEALPIADQIGLNSLLTYDGITYVEFIYNELEPTFKGKYGTSEVGGYTLEALLTARNNALK